MDRVLRPTTVALLLAALAAPCLAGGISTDAAKQIGLRPYWSIDLPMPKRQFLDRLTIVEDNAYGVTDDNYAFAVHNGTGILRWTTQLSKPGQRVQGPDHHGPFAYFTSQNGVRIFNRQTGRPAEEKHFLSGVVIEAVHDLATINIGRLHGVEAGTTLALYNLTRQANRKGQHVADLRVTVVKERQSQARITRFSSTARIESGDIVEGDILTPLPLVALPFAPSSPAVSDGAFAYYGAANNRVYKVRTRDGIVIWQFGMGSPVSATPRLFREHLFVAGQDGKVICCQAADKLGLWTFQTEAPIFATPWVDESGVYVASTDRALYALDRAKGTRRWRQQFSTAELGDPTVLAGTVFINAPGEGFYAFAADTGKQRWQISEPAHFLALDGDTVFLRMGDSSNGKTAGLQSIRTVDLKTGKTRGELSVGQFNFIGATADPITIVVADRRGHVECLRSKSYPHLRPEQLAEVLANDEAARTQAGPKTAIAAKPAAKSAVEKDDPFRSSSKTEPVGGHGLVGGEKPAKPAASSQASSEPATSQPASDKAEGGDEADKGDESGDDMDKAEGGDDEKGKDDKGKDDDSKDDDSKDDDSKDDSSTNDDGGR